MDDQNIVPHNQNEEKTYVCLGTCQAVISEEQYENGLTVCGTEGCTLKGHPLVPGKKNSESGKTEATEE